MQAFTDTVKRYWFLATTFACAALYWLYDRRGRQLIEIHNAEKTRVISAKLEDIKSQATGSKENLDASIQSFEALKRLHPDLLRKLSIGGDSSTGGNPSQSNS